MGRPKKIGLDYFPFDVDFFQDIKIRKLVKYQGGKAITVYALLLCNIYKEGYYMRWDEELPFIISELSGYEEAYVREVLKCCMNIGLIDKDLYEKDGVLSSKGIQERYLLIAKNCNRKGVISEFTLVSCQETPVSSEETRVNSEKSAQSKVKERKINKKDSSYEESKKALSPPLIPGLEEKKSKKQKSRPKETGFSPPTLDDVLEYFSSQDAANRIENWEESARRFYDYFNAVDWKDKSGRLITRWDSRANNWILDDEKRQSEVQNGKPKPKDQRTDFSRGHIASDSYEQRQEDILDYVARNIGTD